MNPFIDHLDSKEEFERTRAAYQYVLRALDSAGAGALKDLEASMGQLDSAALLRLPPQVLQMIADLLGALVEGKAVSIVPKEMELTTNEAAHFLNVSRPYLIGLLEAGKIRFHKVGSHRRIRYEDASRYKEEQRKKSNEALQALADQAQELGLE
jgi:excisionase family DNA binding protein